MILTLYVISINNLQKCLTERCTIIKKKEPVKPFSKTKVVTQKIKSIAICQDWMDQYLENVTSP